MHPTLKIMSLVLKVDFYQKQIYLGQCSGVVVSIGRVATVLVEIKTVQIFSQSKNGDSGRKIN